jgi:hypothetical protein
MTAEILSACPKLRCKVARGALERCVFAAIGLCLAATSIGALGADLTTGSSRPTTVPSQVKGTGHQSMTAPPSVRPDSKLNYLASRSRTIELLYEQLMRSTSPACSSASTYASMAGGC